MKMFYSDLEQAESRAVGAYCFTIFGESGYLDATESGDLHSLVCAMCWRDLPWPEEFSLQTVQKYGKLPEELLKAAKAVAETPAYRDKTYRDLAKILGHGCVTGDHEVLTPSGWVPISETPPIIMQFDGTSLSFVKPSNWIAKKWEGDFIEISGRSISLFATTDHGIIYESDGKLKRISAIEFAIHRKNHWRIPLGYGFVGGTDEVSEETARLIAAYQADGSKEGNKTRFRLKKRRKIQRLYDLASANKVDIQEQKYNRWAISWTFYEKRPGAYMLNWPKKALAAYLHEVRYWDGSIQKSSISIHSKYKIDLEWIQTIGRINGIGGNIQKPIKSGFGTTMYRLQQNNRKFASVKSMDVKFVHGLGQMVYCPTVPGGMFLIRRNGKIHITGNSNYFGKPPTMSKHAHVEKRLVEDFQRRYFGAFPEIPMFHKWVLQQLQLGGELKTLAGRKRIFFGRPDDEKTLREAIAYLAQSFATGDYINIGILDLWKKKLPLWIVSQVHDAAAGYYNEDQEEMILREVKDSLEHRMELRSPNGDLREFFIPTETKVGWNMGYFDEERNPFGLMKIGEGGDPRRRKKQLPRRKKKKIDLSMRIGNVG